MKTLFTKKVLPTKYSIGKQEVILVELVPDLLYAPEAFLKQQRFDELAGIASDFLKTLPPVAVKYPWIVGSFMTDISGRLRKDSPSHTQGIAIDIAPMYNKISILAPDGHTLQMAWNLIDLAVLGASSYRGAAWVVEGDHIHMQISPNANDLPSNSVVSVPTLSTWYDLSRKISDAANITSSVLRRVYVWHKKDGIFCQDSKHEGVLEGASFLRHYLGHTK